MYAADDDARLYILMRDDLASLNPGKAVAQGAHAANLAIKEMREWAEADCCTDESAADFLEEWEGDRGFGTTITLATIGPDLELTIAAAIADGLCAGLVLDPTYPLRDGQVTHLIPLVTCGYIFTRKSLVKDILAHLTLMP